MSDGLLAVLSAPWLGNVLGLLGIIIGVVVGWYYYRKARQVARLRHSLGDTPLVEMVDHDDAGDLTVHFRGEPVPQVTSSSYGLWNDGTVTFRGADIVESDPIRLVVPGQRILAVSVENASRAAVDATIIQTAPDSATISFDFLDPGDGFRVRVLHTGSIGDLRSAGIVRGLPNGLQRFDADAAATRVLGIFLILAGVAVLVGIGLLIYLLGVVAWNGTWTARFWLLAFVAFVLFCTFADHIPIKAASGPRRVRGVPLAVSEDRALLRWHTHPVLLGSTEDTNAQT